MISLPIICRRFIGRRDQLNLLQDRWRETRTGRGSTILVAGEAGYGKSRLVREFCESIVGESSGFVRGECLEYAPGPFAPFIDVLRALIRDRPDALRDALAVRRILSPMFPEFGTLNALPLEVNTRQQFDAYVEALRRLLGTRRTVVVVEDLHWADEGTLGLLQHLVVAATDLPMLLVTTYRPDELTRNHRLVPVIAKINRMPHVFPTRLERFDGDEMDEWLGEVSNAHPTLSRDALQNTRRLAEGNPLFAEELITHAMGGGADLPLTLRETVLERLRPLPEDERLILVAAAVVGERFDPAIVAETLDCSVSDVLPVLRHARALRLVVEDERDDTFRFRHALMRDILYRELLAPEARTLHARIAAALERRPDRAARSVELAYHFWEARDMEGAARYSESAGDDAVNANTFDDASEYYERALKVVEGTTAHSAGLYAKLARSLGSAGLAERATRAFNQAIAHYQSIGDVDKVADMFSDLAVQQTYLGEVEEAISTGGKALDLLRHVPESPTRLKILSTLASMEARRHDFAASLALSEAALVFSNIDLQRKARLLSTRAFALAGTGDFASARRAADDALLIAQNTEDYISFVLALNNAALVYAEAGDDDAAIELHELSAASAAESFLGVDEAIALFNITFRSLVRGNLAGAVRATARALAVCRRVEVPLLEITSNCVTFMMALRLDESTVVDRRAEERTFPTVLRAGLPFTVLMGGAITEYMGRQDRMAEAQAIFSRSVDALRPSTAIFSLVHVAQFGAATDVQRLRAVVEPWAALLPTGRGLGYLAYIDACLAQCDGDRADTVRHALDAARVFADIEHPFPQALALELAGKPHDALEIYRRIGSTRDARRLDTTLTPKGRRDRRIMDLSQREREVARLIAAGRSNKAIAVALGISGRTVENHVASAMKKLGAASRTELAAMLARAEP